MSTDESAIEGGEGSRKEGADARDEWPRQKIESRVGACTNSPPLRWGRRRHTRPLLWVKWCVPKEKEEKDAFQWLLGWITKPSCRQVAKVVVVVVGRRGCGLES